VKIIVTQFVKKSPIFYGTPKARSCIHKSLPSGNPVHTLISYFCKIHLNIILQSAPRLPIYIYIYLCHNFPEGIVDMQIHDGTTNFACWHQML
jgi:hypothetical protein